MRRATKPSLTIGLLDFTFVGATTFVLAAAVSSAAFAQSNIRSLPTAGKWSVTPELGTSVNLDGGFVDGESLSLEAGAVVGQPCDKQGPNGCFLGFGVNADFDATVEDTDFNDVYDPDIGVGISVNYGLSDMSEVFGRFRYTSFGADDFTIATADTAGSVIVDGKVIPINGGDSFEADMDDYEELSLTIGYRRFFEAGNGFHPFASIEGGVAFVDDIAMKLSSSSSGNVGKTGFYDDSTIFTGGIGLGFRYDMAENMAIGAEGTIRYTDDLDSDSDITTSANSGDDRLDLTLAVGFTWAF